MQRLVDNRLDLPTEVVMEGMGTGHLQRVQVKGTVLEKIPADHHRDVLGGHCLQAPVDLLIDFRIVDPVDQLELVAEMIVKTLPVQVALRANLANRDFLQGLFRHTFFERARQSPLCYRGV